MLALEETRSRRSSRNYCPPQVTALAIDPSLVSKKAVDEGFMGKNFEPDENRFGNDYWACQTQPYDWRFRGARPCQATCLDARRGMRSLERRPSANA